MYRLYSASNENIGVTEKLNYVRLHANGCYVLCEEKEAQGIAFNGEVYSLGLANSFTDKPVVRVTKTDTAVEIENNIATTGIAFVTMAEAGSIDAVTAAEHAELFSEWTCPIAYKTGNIRRYKGVLYKCIQDHTSQADWTPDTAVSLWTLTADPAEEWPAWSQPVGAHDAYSLGDQVSHNEKHWTSDVDGNVWEPGVYGWTEVPDETEEEVIDETEVEANE